jgi:transposase-like protein
MEHDFVYCPRCTRYSIFHWVRGIGQWECEDCTYKLPKDDSHRFAKEQVMEWTTSAT